MARPTKRTLPDIIAAHDAIVNAHSELRDAMLANPPRNEIEVDRYQGVMQQFRIWEDTFTTLENEHALYASANPADRKRSRMTSIKEVLLLNAASREAISLYAGIVQRKKEIEATASRDDILRRIADRVTD
jgi:hypothetical protein